MAMPIKADVKDFATEKDVTIESRCVALKYFSYRTLPSWMTMKAWVWLASRKASQSSTPASAPKRFATRSSGDSSK